MRLFLIAATGLLATQASNAAKPGNPVADSPEATCKRAGAHPAWQGQPLKPRKLHELPRAEGYLAVYRRVNGCEAPMMLTRNPKGR